MANYKLEIINTWEINIPSASGVVYAIDSLWIVGDNASHLYQTNLQGKILQTVDLIPYSYDTVIPKKIKPDWEGIALVNDEIHLIASGSKKENRNTYAIYNLSNSQMMLYDLSDLYKHAMQQLQINISQFNIEGLAVYNNYIYLCNRETNNLLMIELNNFYKYLFHNQIPEIEIKEITPPSINSTPYQISGMEIGGTGKFLLTLSAEDRANPIDDGAVLGSTLGIGKNIDAVNEINYLPFPIINNEILKIESITIAQEQDKEMNCYAVSDSDGGSSMLVELKIFI
jgi:hypothetical protein